MIFPITVAVGLGLQSATSLLEIPRPFWGEYNERLADCGTGNNDSRLRISWDRLRFYESTGELRELIRYPDGSLTVVAEHTGEGQTWTNVYHLRLSNDGNALRVIHPQTSEMEQTASDRLRCPTGRSN